MDQYPKPLRSKLAMFYESIEKARLGGFSWDQILDALVKGGVVEENQTPKNIATVWRMTKNAVEVGKLAKGDKPLPGTKAQPANSGQTRPLPAAPGQKPLPVLPGQKIPDPEELKDEFAKHGLHFR